jgi:hypothetical protein
VKAPLRFAVKKLKLAAGVGILLYGLFTVVAGVITVLKMGIYYPVGCFVIGLITALLFNPPNHED